MSEGIRRTCREFAETLVRLGIATQEQADAGLAEAGRFGFDVDEKFEDADQLTFLVGECGLGFTMPEKMSGGVDEGYESLLRDAAACSGGSVVVDDIELVEDEDGEEYLHVRRNGRSLWYHTEHDKDFRRYMDWMAASDAIGDLVPGGDDPRNFHQLDGDPLDAWWLLLTPEQAAGLKEFGLPMPNSLGNVVRNGLPTAEPGTPAWYLEDDRLHASEESRRFLDAWLASMDTALDRWRTAHLPDGFPVDFSLESLAALERLVWERFEGPDALKTAAGDEFAEGAIRYIGETALRLWPCRWTYQHSDDEADLFANDPAILSHAPSGFATEVFPSVALRLVVEDREPGTLAERLEDIPDSVDDYRRALRARTAGR
ncbi:hypothetical protein [Streptomyces sp. NPDC101150]|uniref:hypothetical protein n=1 Tax=Streptomyces sp. NPDC101150 TaxID=3366114 RepID=UPI003818C2BF